MIVIGYIYLIGRILFNASQKIGGDVSHFQIARENLIIIIIIKFLLNKVFINVNFQMIFQIFVPMYW